MLLWWQRIKKMKVTFSENYTIMFLYFRKNVLYVWYFVDTINMTTYYVITYWIKVTQTFSATSNQSTMSWNLAWERPRFTFIAVSVSKTLVSSVASRFLGQGLQYLGQGRTLITDWGFNYFQSAWFSPFIFIFVFLMFTKHSLHILTRTKVETKSYVNYVTSALALLCHKYFLVRAMLNRRSYQALGLLKLPHSIEHLFQLTNSST